MTPLKTEAERTQPETSPEEPRPRFQPIKLRGGSPKAASDELMRGRGRNPDYYEDLPLPESDGVNPLQIRQCYLMLKQAEETGKKPITLDWFRDYAMLHSFRVDWADSAEFRQRVIDKTIEANGIRIASMPNESTAGPDVTTLSTVKIEVPADGYHPITVRGEPVSVTLIRDRGGY